MLGQLNITPIISERSLTTAAGSAFPDTLSARLVSYEQTIAATVGFETCTLVFTAESLDEALTWSGRLFSAVEVTGPAMETCWQGFIDSIELRIGGRTRSYALETVANQVRTAYTSVLAQAATTAATSNAVSIALYGTRDAVLSIAGASAAQATGLRDAWLKRYAFPRPRPATSLKTGELDRSGIAITLRCQGWYTTLGLVVLERADTSNEASTAQVGTLIGTSSPGIGAINPFISSNTALITATGVSTSRRIEANTTYRAAIEQRLTAGDTSGERLAWGVYEDRRLTVKPWAGADLTTARIYRISEAEAKAETTGGVEVPWWSVRPDALIEDLDVLVAGPPSGAVDNPERWFLERTVFTADQSGMSLTLEPEATNSLDARLARLAA